MIIMIIPLPSLSFVFTSTSSNAQIERILLLFFGICGTLLSLAVLWSEVTFSTSLSIYAQIITSAGKSHQVDAAFSLLCDFVA